MDVLSLSATPIPAPAYGPDWFTRFIVIETTPVGRYPITSYVMDTMKSHPEGVMAEVEQGQVLVHNRIEDIEAFCSELEAILRNKDEIAHGACLKSSWQT